MKPQNTSGSSHSTFSGKMDKNLDHWSKPNDEWVSARNAVNNSAVGDIGKLSTEASNRLCTMAPYTIHGVIHIQADQFVIFSTDDVSSEIGIFEEDKCSYTKIVNSPCLNFNKDFLIKGVARTTYSCGRQVYWDDGNSPTRVLNLDNVPWVQNCQVIDSCNICTDTTNLDCEKIRLAPLVKNLTLRLEKGQISGELINGSYYVTSAYLIEGKQVTDYVSPSNVVGLFEHPNIASSLEVFVDEADTSFDEFELVLVQFANFNTVARQIGRYSTKQKKIVIDQIDEKLPTIDPGLILIQNPVVERTDGVFKNGSYMIRTGPQEKFDFNYQPLANQIKANWVSVEYPQDYYRKGGWKTGYLRDEVYSFFIRFVYSTGDKSRSYHIPGRISTSLEEGPVGGDDVLPGDGGKYWNVYNTGSVDPLYGLANSVLPDNGIVLGGGPMSYWESSELYDDKHPEIWNSTSDPMWGTNDTQFDLCGKPIRHHKFPDNASDSGPDMITNHYDPNTGSKIRILGVQFSNIKPPLDNYGNPITNIVSYEILRGSREGNKTILAKGMINNLREYISTDQNPTRRYLYPNYPYNPTAPAPWENGGGNYVLDHFLSSIHTSYNPGGGTFSNNVNHNNAYLEDDVPLGQPIVSPQGGSFFENGTNILKDMITFHSPDTNFRNPFLSAKEIKIYGELNGTMEGRFQFPEKHPKHKFLTDMSFLASAIIGIGYALISTEGKKTMKHLTPKTDFGGTYTEMGYSFGTTGLIGPSAVPAAAMISANTAASLSDQLTSKVLSHSMLSMLQSMVGIDPNIPLDFARTNAGLGAGFLGGTGSQDEYGRETTAWGATPALLRLVQGVPAFLTYYAEGIDKMLNIIYAFTPYRQYALQQISHCFYDKFSPPDVGDMRRAISDQSYLSPHLQDFAGDRINNIYRSRTVALKINSDLATPHKVVDDSQALFSDVWPRTSIIQWENEDYINSTFKRPASSHYVALKQRISNQYGQLDGIIQVPITAKYIPVTQTTSDILFGGDVYVGRYTEKNTMFFFYDWLLDQPDGSVFNYRLRKMITHPRFWMDSDPFDVGEFVSSLGTLFGSNNSAPGAFDPFMIDPAINTTDPNSISYVANPICECGNYTDCLFTSADLQPICDMEEEQRQLILYKEFIEECACYVNTSDSPYCNDDGTVLNPVLDPEFIGCTAVYTPGCSVCPNFGGLFSTNSAVAGNYLEEGRGRYARRINRLEKQIGRLGRKIERAKKKLYDDYLDGLDGNQENFWKDMTDNIVTPNDKYAFDMRKPGGAFGFNVKQAWMYLFNSGVRDFFVESEINLDQRDWGEAPEERHYDHGSYTDLKELFASSRIRTGNFMKYDYSLSISKLFNYYTSWGLMQDKNYDPAIAEKCYVYRPKRMIYSLPQNEENRSDNWRVFLPLNYKDFSSIPVNVKPIGKNGAIIFFKNESPVQFAGVDQLQTDGGIKITIGDGGLFSQPLQNISNAEYPHEFGSCQNRLSVVNTPAGIFYISQNQGKIFQIAESLSEISLKDMKWWFANNLPYKLTNQFPGFELLDNPVVGIGCQTVYDNKNEVIFFSKKDWVLKENLRDSVSYLGGRVFRYQGRRIELGDPTVFESASWTVSYDPKSQNWISFHDWHPDLTIPTKRTFMTTKNNGLWVHADRCDSYCNFYNTNYPFEVEFTMYEPIKVSTLRNVTYFLEAFQYSKNCTDRFHNLDFNFDEAVIYNTEQCSGLLKLHLQPKNDLVDMLRYPIINFQSIDILYSKEEQKYRFNQFWDITDDRGEFNTYVKRPIWNTEPDGYRKILNAANLNYQKLAHERKKFRHYQQTVLLRRNVCGSNQMIISLALSNTLFSPR